MDEKIETFFGYGMEYYVAYGMEYCVEDGKGESVGKKYL